MSESVASEEEVVAGRVYSERKQAYKKQLEDLCDNYSKCLIVQADNVGSQQMHQIRAALRGKAEILMGKNTMIRFVINNYAKETKNEKLQALSGEVNFNVGLVFTNEDLVTVRDVLVANRVGAAARAGSIAPLTVVVPAGPTGLEPTQTAFFQALSVPTKINKGSIDILSDVTLITEGEKVGPSEVALLNKLGIRPFSYGLVVTRVYDNGAVYDADVLDITPAHVSAALLKGIHNIAAFSLAPGVKYPTKCAVIHSIFNGLKACVAVGLEADLESDVFTKIKAAIGK